MSDDNSAKITRSAEAGYFLRIILLVLQNKVENARGFYLPNASVLRSFFAFVWCLPAQLFMWSLLWNKLAEQSSGEIISKTGFMLQLTFIDMLGWAMSAAAIFIILSAVNMKKAIGPLIIASNWFSLLAVYVFFIPDTLSYFLPALSEFIDVVDFIVYFTIVGLYFRLVKHVLGDQKMIAFAITLASLVMGLFLSSMAFQSVMQA
jgi:hypothetical protein